MSINFPLERMRQKVDPATIFSAANKIAMAGWLAMVVAPRARFVTWWICGLGIPGLLASLYALLMVWYAPHAEGGFGSLAAVAAMFRDDGVLLAGWLHYLAFDMFIGAWMCRRAAAEQLNAWAVRLCLPPTFLAGPVGLLLFLGLRGLLTRGIAR
ncbi:ABA4-like family protein [Roseomonas rosulenta]|uniref:ABA4-like family protein n=1 Tax=Roseomonas rosulenta TaxID=2748667 RepID=UPI0018DF869F|nr:ABA4-like family protein [Roseomonas rosulenta]